MEEGILAIKCGHKIASTMQMWRTTTRAQRMEFCKPFSEHLPSFSCLPAFSFSFLPSNVPLLVFPVLLPYWIFKKYGISMTTDLKPIKTWKSNRDWQHKTIILAIWEAEAGESQLAHRVSLRLICEWEGANCVVGERPWVWDSTLDRIVSVHKVLG